MNIDRVSENGSDIFFLVYPLILFTTIWCK